MSIGGSMGGVALTRWVTGEHLRSFTADGQTFLLNAGGGQYLPYTVIVNWPELFRANSDDS